MIDFGYLWHLYGPPFVSGSITTLQVTFAAVGLGIVIGLPLALIRLFGPRPAGFLANAYIEVFRGTPLLVQLFVMYYGLPSYGIVFDPLTAAVLTLGMNSGGYQAELYRGAIQSVDAGQVTAARAIGMSQMQAMRYIVLPQALRAVLPSWSNELVGVMKGTAVVFLISVQDLMGEAKIIFGRTFDPIQAYSVVAVVYLVLIGATVILLGALERRLRLPALDVGTDRR